MPTLKEIKALLAATTAPAFSLYVPLGPGFTEGHANRLRFREAIRQAIRIRAAGEDPKEFNKLARGLEAAAEPTVLSKGGGTLALLQSPTLTKTYHLPVRLPLQVFVGASFHIKPLVDFVLADDRFWLLELDKGRVRLWAGDTSQIRAAEIKSLPTRPEQVLGYEYSRDYEVVHRGSHGPRPRHGHVAVRSVTPAFSGHGVGANDRNDEARQFFRAVDDALVSWLSGSGVPVILAATPENESLYRSVSQLDNLAAEGIKVAIRHWDLDQIHRSARRITMRTAEAAVGEALQLWEESYNRDKTEADPAALARYAVAGRIRLLMAERGRRLLGTLDRDTGALSVENGSRPGIVDIPDELIELTILHGGRVLLVSPSRMPTQTGVAAILR
jgi:hypothetical protein